jgi:multidrug efflux system outer membrane protein
MRRLIPLLAVLVLTSACTVGPDYVKPEVDTPERWRITLEESTEAINTAWWQQFSDPTLDRLIDTALRNNRDVRIAAARVMEFAARIDVANADRLPQLGYDGFAARSKSLVPGGGSITGNNFQATLNAGWELDIWGRIARATEAARANLLAAAENRRSVILTLVSTVATSYIQLLNLDQQLAIVHQTVESRHESLELFQTQFEGGVISELELAQVRSEYELARVRIPEVERQIALLENALSVLLGNNPGSIERGGPMDALTAPPVPVGIPSTVLAGRPDILAAEQQLISANAQIGVARAQYFPVISLTGLFGYASTDLSELLQSSSNIWSVGGGLFGPIFDGGRIGGNVRASEAVQRQALVNYLKVVQQAFREVDDALINTAKTREILAAQKRHVDALRDYARFARLRYDEGQVSYIEVLDADRRLFDAELGYESNQADVYTALVSVYKAMGGGWVAEAVQAADTVDFPQPTQAEPAKPQARDGD